FFLCFAAFSQESKLVALDKEAGDELGSSVALDGIYAILGAEKDGDFGSNSGAAFVMKRVGFAWQIRIKLIALKPSSQDHFGHSVSISGDYAVVGAYGDGSNAGAAYVFKRSGDSWKQEARLQASDRAQGDKFGESVSISGDYVIIGAKDNSDQGASSGSAYIFKRNAAIWTQQAKLTATGASAGDFFGCSVSISGDLALIGSSSDDDNGSSSGAAYVFNRAGVNWSQTVKLTQTAASAGDEFGASVCIAGDSLIVGAVHDNDAAANAGAAYIFTKSGGTWSQATQLLAPNPAANDEFGFSVSISDSIAVVGAPLSNEVGSNSGGAFAFRGDGTSWTHELK
ncbi:MAG: FG-GAP repeat protein, partial [Methylococcales bacterium]|nr:FG-GAP repeat protein [Methylococcales bacterium]